MRATFLSLFLHLWVIGLSTTAPANPPASGKPETLNIFNDDPDAPPQSTTNTTVISTLLHTTSLTTNVRINYKISDTDLSISLVYMPHRPLDRRALGSTLQRAQLSRRAYLAAHPDAANSYLERDDDPFRVDYLRTGKCAIRIESVKPGEPGSTRRMTYQGVLDVLGALWEVLYLERMEFESVFEVKNGSVVVGWGTVLVGNVP
ncbi:MAG: hypothetical protein LQ346_004379 [Caloplaca aetnensis]|nr:MAG: hypothetical protein LQ346_004379 [Caloplaca aetnensis]